MEYVACILISVILSKLYIDLTIKRYDRVITEHIKNTSEVTFDTVLNLLKKIGIIKQ